MSTLKSDVITSKTTNGDLTISGDGSGVPDLEAGFKVGSVAGVPTASIRDDAVTLAKMASGTDGQIITYDASGNPTAVGPGSDGEVLTSTGAGSPPAFEAAGGGGSWNIVGTAVASDSATLTVTGIDTTYDTYAFAFSTLVPASSNQSLRLRVGDSAGIDSANSDYEWHMHHDEPDSATSQIFISGTNAEQGSFIALNDGTGANSGESTGGMFYLVTGGNTAFTLIYGTTHNIYPAGIFRSGNVLGRRKAIIAVTQIQLQFQSANIASGRLTVWGIAHA